MTSYDKPSPQVYLVHHGIKGQKWGIRRYQNEDGSLTVAGKKRQQRIENAEKHAWVLHWRARLQQKCLHKMGKPRLLKLSTTCPKEHSMRQPSPHKYLQARLWFKA